MVVLDSKRLEKSVAYHCEMCHFIRCASVNGDGGGCEGMLAMISHDEHFHLADASVTVPHIFPWEHVETDESQRSNQAVNVSSLLCFFVKNEDYQ